ATVLGATSGPWAPPDQASRGSTRFDVYGLAATLLQCVTQQEFQDYHHIAQALVDPDPPPEVVDLLTLTAKSSILNCRQFRQRVARNGTGAGKSRSN
ncbi:hypothetical protein, partial [Mycobacterium marinum]|uniref:hypothetical protein n=1 Tax=Mycobacterium marinum TaxID=1781 RepID=UPI0035657B64